MRKDLDQWFYDHPKIFMLTCVSALIFGVGMGVVSIKNNR